MSPRLAFEVLRLAVITLILASLVAASLAAATRRPQASGLTVVAFLALLAWPPLFRVVVLASTPSLVVLSFIAVVLLLCVLAFRMYHPALRFLILAAIVINSISVAAVASWDRFADADVFAFPNRGQVSSPATTDVVIIVLDGYGRPDTMKDSYGYDNVALRGQLDDLRFSIIEKATSNYQASSLSIGSFFAQDYIATPESPLTNSERLAIQDLVGGNNPLVRSLQESGRHYTHVSSPWVENRCAQNVDQCIRGPVYDSLALAWMQQDSFFGPVSYATTHPFPASAGGILASLASTDFSSGLPQAIFIHVVSPHAPYMLSADCSRATQRPEGTIQDQFACVDQLVIDSLGNIPRDAIVVIFGDHGPDFPGLKTMAPQDWTNEQILNRMAPFVAVRLSDDCTYPPPDASLINISRYVSACALGEEPQPLPNRSFITPVGYPNTEAPMLEVFVPMTGTTQPDND